MDLTVLLKLLVAYLPAKTMETKEQLDQKFKETLDKYLARRPDAFQWIVAFWQLGHQWDDLIDIPERRSDNTFIGQVLSKYIDVLSAPFYHQYLHRLYPVVKVVHHVFQDSLEWEKSDVAWKATYADVFRCSGSHLIMAVVELVVLEETGSYDLAYEAVREISMLAKECAWMTHHNERGEKI